MLIGAHESVAGGFAISVRRAREDGCEAFQVFTAAPGRWTLDAKVVGAGPFRAAAGAEGYLRVLAHAPYLVNIASPDRSLWKRSVIALTADYRRAVALGACALVLHPGSHRGAGEGEGERRVAEGLSRLFDAVKTGPLLLLENTAGSGDALGSDFASLSRIRARALAPARVGYCLDTAHAFAAGYDLRTPRSVRASLSRVDGEADLGLVRAFHLNDSARPLGSRVDRHARIGEGGLGLSVFRSLVNDPRFAGLPGVIETVPHSQAQGRYRPQVELLKGLRRRRR